MKVFFVVKGPLIWLDEKGDHSEAISMCTTTSPWRANTTNQVGLGAYYVNRLFR